MEAKFKSLSIFEFQEQFPNEESCYKYLAYLKWNAGYTCSKCGNNRSCRGKKEFDRQCTKCCYCESTTSGTLFHKVKFSIHKAFWMVYFVSTNKKGISSTELSRKLQIRQKTCWLFRMKIQQAMASSGSYPLEGDVEVDEFVVGQKEQGAIGRKNKSKRLVTIAIEKKGKGVSRIYTRQIEKASKKSLEAFLRDKTEETAQIRSDCWSAYKALSKEMPNLKPEKSEKGGRNFPLIHRVIMGIKAWLRGTHGHAKHLQFYLDEYCYRFNRHLMKEGVFNNLLLRMVRHHPCPYKMIIS